MADTVCPERGSGLGDSSLHHTAIPSVSWALENEAYRTKLWLYYWEDVEGWN
ncbi:hypothetical protein BDW66DRAFT_145763 [Aspergillus desertorum]